MRVEIAEVWHESRCPGFGTATACPYGTVTHVGEWLYIVMPDHGGQPHTIAGCRQCLAPFFDARRRLAQMPEPQRTEVSRRAKAAVEDSKECMSARIETWTAVIQAEPV